MLSFLLICFLFSSTGETCNRCAENLYGMDWDPQASDQENVIILTNNYCSQAKTLGCSHVTLSHLELASRYASAINCLHFRFRVWDFPCFCEAGGVWVEHGALRTIKRGRIV